LDPKTKIKISLSN